MNNYQLLKGGLVPMTVFVSHFNVMYGNELWVTHQVIPPAAVDFVMIFYAVTSN